MTCDDRYLFWDQRIDIAMKDICGRAWRDVMDSCQASSVSVRKVGVGAWLTWMKMM